MITPSEREAALLGMALGKPIVEREAWLQAVCGEDPSLRQRLDALLAEYEETPGPLTDSLAQADEPTIKLNQAAGPRDERVGQTLGRYKLREKLGEGGCGTVYVAEQTEPVRRRVALKVIKLGMDTREVIARFEAERQALAMMDHPNIARVLDAGTTEAGRPYFVMELVRGIPITDYCDQANLDTKARLDLFIKVCQAIQHAHQKGIIHRDIKPSNILVTLHDGVPVPKVIDFGIAKATEGRLTDSTVYTQLNQFIGTPAYMSPEQAEMSGLDIDTRSDIYSLGVLLYELLAGSTPFDAGNLMSSGLDGMRKTIREKEPQRLSTRLATLGPADLIITAKCRSTDPAKLRQQLKGDLDWIVMKCLEKDRKFRYETANGLAADLKRHLNNEPVTARPPSTAYRFQKSFRRNKLVFTAAAAVAVALVVGTGVALWQAEKAKQEQAIAAAKSAEALASEALAKAETARAITESTRATQTADFLTQLLDKASGEINNGRNPEALKLALDKSAALLVAFEADPALQSDLLGRLCSFYDTIGDRKTTLALMETRIALIARLHGPDSEEAHEFELAYLSFMNDYGARFSVPAKLNALQERVEKSSGRGSPVWFLVQRELVRCWIKLKSARNALSASREGLTEAKKQNLSDLKMVNVQLTRITALEQAQQFDAALAMLEECRLIAGRLENSGRILDKIQDRELFVLESSKNFGRGVEILRNELTRLQSRRGESHQALVPVLQRLARFESNAGQHDQAIGHGQTALALARQLDALQSEGGETLRATILETLCQLTDFEINAGRYEDALRYAGEAMSNAQEQGTRKALSSALKRLSLAERAAGHLEEAYRAHEAQINLKETSAIGYESIVYELWQMNLIRLEQDRPAEATTIASEMWARGTADPVGQSDAGFLRSLARQGLKSWTALKKSHATAPPPAELAAWQSIIAAGNPSKPVPPKNQ